MKDLDVWLGDVDQLLDGSGQSSGEWAEQVKHNCVKDDCLNQVDAGDGFCLEHKAELSRCDYVWREKLEHVESESAVSSVTGADCLTFRRLDCDGTRTGDEPFSMSGEIDVEISVRDHHLVACLLGATCSCLECSTGLEHVDPGDGGLLNEVGYNRSTHGSSEESCRAMGLIF